MLAYLLYFLDMPDILSILADGTVGRELAAVANVHPTLLSEYQLVLIISCDLLLGLEVTLEVEQEDVLVGTTLACAVYDGVMQLAEDT